MIRVSPLLSPEEYMVFGYISCIIFTKKVSMNTVSQMSQSDINKHWGKKSRSYRKSVGMKVTQNSFPVSATLTVKITS